MSSRRVVPHVSVPVRDDRRQLGVRRVHGVPFQVPVRGLEVDDGIVGDDPGAHAVAERRADARVGRRERFLERTPVQSSDVGAHRDGGADDAAVVAVVPAGIALALVGRNHALGVHVPRVMPVGGGEQVVHALELDRVRDPERRDGHGQLSRMDLRSGAVED